MACRYVLKIKRNAFPESGNRLNALSKEELGMVYMVQMLMTNVSSVPSSHSAPFHFKTNKNSYLEKTTFHFLTLKNRLRGVTL